MLEDEDLKFALKQGEFEPFRSKFNELGAKNEKTAEEETIHRTVNDILNHTSEEYPSASYLNELVKRGNSSEIEVEYYDKTLALILRSLLKDSSYAASNNFPQAQQPDEESKSEVNQKSIDDVTMRRVKKL